MHNKRISLIVILIVIFMGSFVFNLNKVFSYSGDPTHYNLTYEIIKFYNLFYGPDIKQSQLEQILKGSLDEDVLPRPAFHLYDPIYDRAPFGVYTAKEWALDVDSQNLEKFLGILEKIFGKNNYSAHGDFSWFASVDYFMANNQEKAWYGLGHILHLIEDMTVPAHSRNDHHILGEPYEEWTSVNLKSEDYSLADKLKSNDYSPVYLFSIGQAFDELAKYSNKYFFSKDTILSKDYLNPKIIKEQEEDYGKYLQRIYAMGKDENGNFIRLAHRDVYKASWQKISPGAEKENDVYIIDGMDPKIHNDYWFHLAPKAVVYGAGVIKLFVDELEWREELVKYDTKKELSLLQRGQVFVNNLLGIGQNNQQEEQGSQQEYVFQELSQPKPMKFPVSGDIVKEPVFVPIENVEDSSSTEVPVPVPQDGTTVSKEKSDGSIVVTGPKTGDSGGVSPFVNQPPEELISSSSEEEEDKPSISEPLHLVINEIQIRNNEFIELYNPTASAIDLSGYYFSYFSKTRDWNDPWRNQQFPTNASISASGYYLIGFEGYSASSGNPDSDWQMYDSQQLSNSDGSVAIFSLDPTDTTKTIDEVKAGVIDAVAWGGVDFVKEGTEFQQALGQDKSMQRINSQDTNNNNADFEFRKIPSPTNSNNETRIPGTIIPDNTVISEDTTWTVAGSPYYIESNLDKWPKVLGGAILTIEPAAIIMSQNQNYTFLEIQGTLKAEGNVSEKIVFTSKNDSDYGGAGSASAGDWKNIVFTDTSSNSVLDYVLFRYGGQTNGEMIGMIKIEGSSVGIKNSTIENSQSNGIYLKNSDSKIIDSIISDNQIGIIIETGNPEINGCQIKNNSLYGVDIKQDSAPKIKDNSFFNNSIAAIYLKSSYPEFGNNSASNNGLNGILVDSKTKIEQDEIWEADLVYILESNFGDYVTVANGSVLTLEPGVVIKFRSQIYTAMVTEGTLLAQAASGSEIVFTSIKDDSFGGDTNNDGNLITEPKNNDWKEILFKSTSINSIFDYVFMYYSNPNPIKLESGASVEEKDVRYEP